MLKNGNLSNDTQSTAPETNNFEIEKKIIYLWIKDYKNI